MTQCSEKDKRKERTVLMREMRMMINHYEASRQRKEEDVLKRLVKREISWRKGHSSSSKRKDKNEKKNG